MRTFGDAIIPETASEFKQRVIEKLREQLKGEPLPDNTQWVLQGFTNQQLEDVIVCIQSFDDERMIPAFEACEEEEPRS
jgi:hypothetical protein